MRNAGREEGKKKHAMTDVNATRMESRKRNATASKRQSPVDDFLKRGIIFAQSKPLDEERKYRREDAMPFEEKPRKESPFIRC